MNARTINELLTEFEPKRAVAGAAERVVPFERRVAAGGPASSGPASQNDFAARLEEAYQRGKTEGHAAAIADCEAKLKEYAVASARRRADERERWINEQGNVLAEQFTRTWGGFESGLTGTLARLLEPVLADAIRHKALGEFIGHLDAVIKDAGAGVMRVSGPEDLLEVIKSKVAGGAVTLEYVTGTSCEVRLVSDQAILETQMQAWIDRLKPSLP